jgi:hypothetical protein
MAMERSLLSVMARRHVLVALLAGLVTAAPAGAQTDRLPGCPDYSLPNVLLPNGYPFDVYAAVALFRFHRQKEALGDLDQARALARGPWRWRLPPDLRDDVTSALDALRTCLATHEPPQLATLTVRVLGYRDDAPDRIGPQAGARVYVEGIAVGRTGRGGRLTVRVPSGPIMVEAEIPIGQWNLADISLAAGQSKSIDITLSDGKEVSERTALVLTEAVDDIVPRASTSLTLKFMRDGRIAPVARIEQIDVVDRDGNFIGGIAEHFAVVGGAIVATNAAAVFDALVAQFDQTVVLQVHAMASEQHMHQGTIAFRVGQSPLSVTLLPPPSNPGLPVSNIEVGLSIPGAGIAMQRTSDANGRIDIDGFPHGTVVLECVTTSNGRYYYCDGVLVHGGPRSVSLVLRHVQDVVNGVPPLR